MKPQMKNEPVGTEKVEAEKVDVPQEPESKLPDGVFHHDAGTPPMIEREQPQKTDPGRPPPGWVGAWSQCGGCGAFLGVQKNCPKCFPYPVPENIHNIGKVQC
jgi:hypothetical protein